MDHISKFQPHRTIHLQGFDGFGAAAALWGASDIGFNVSGVFRDQGDFAVLLLFQKDDPFGHPRFSYLPDGNVTGLKLDFDIEFQGIQAFESHRWPWIDWASINAYDESGNLLQHPLLDLATGPSGRTGASGTFTLNVGTPQTGDEVTLWYQNLAFDYIASSGAGGSCIQSIFWQSASNSCEQDMWWQSVTTSCAQSMWWQGDHESCVQALWWQGNSAYSHWVRVQGNGWDHTYSVAEDGLNSAQVAQAIASQINASDPFCGATVGGAYGNEITIILKTLQSITMNVSSSDGSAPATLNMYVHWVQIGGARYQAAENGMNSAQIAQALAGQINAADPNCTATAGADGNANDITITLKTGVSGPIQVSSSDGSGPATIGDYVHWVKVGTATYSCAQGALSSARIAANVASQIAANDPKCTATTGGASGNGVIVSLRSGVAGPIQVSSSDGSASATLSDYVHSVNGERSLYVKDLVLAHRRQWGWRFVDEFCWRKTDNGVPGGWNNRFKNAWEPVFHFCRQQQIKFRPKRVGHESEDCFDYSPNNPKSTSGSGLLGTGPRGAAADGGKNQSAWQRSRSSLSQDSEGRYEGIARPSNVVEVKSESSQGSHSAPFPRALVEFFVLAFSDEGDVILDPFMGSGTTMAAAAGLGRAGYGCEISPAYCDVIVQRISTLTGEPAMLVDTGQLFVDVAHARGVPVDQAMNPKAQDSRAIKHHGPNPHYGPKRKTA